MMKKILAAALMLLISGCSIINRYKDANQILTGCTYIRRFSDDTYKLVYEVHSKLPVRYEVFKDPTERRWLEFEKYMEPVEVEDTWHNMNYVCEKPGYRYIHLKDYKYYKIDEENLSKIQELYEKYPYWFEVIDQVNNDTYRGEAVWPLIFLDENALPN